MVLDAVVADFGEELAAYHAHFAPFFTRAEQRVWAEVYLRGLLVAPTPKAAVAAQEYGSHGVAPAGGGAGSRGAGAGAATVRG